ncbi:hypothetical protein O0I10_013122 [Lichtheimia ornata]|uniref:Integrase catalytic domain-containing protein n=1 Tax=Lichtheimia ornata TaxID=688661 RepID=A0AAD7URN2_9FUNG|nr:uncharacterized protein O0I10_013122 [Lichtheimia ornata]KAJ8651362.1 hypothetical protein O0I10_013122 [Lichtheimia ornata]
MVDVCTRFCVLHALPDKSSDTVVQAVINTFCDYGFPRYLQSDNGTEFVNALMRKLKESAGFDHRLATPYHPRANGLAERFVQTTTNVIRKNVDGATKDWDLYVKPIQLALNNKVASCHGTTPFALMFNRAINGFRDYSNDDIPRPLQEDELMERIDLMSKTVFSAISERATALAQLKKGKHDAKYRMIKFPPGSKVMVKDMLRSKKLDPRYEGPYTVVRETQGGSYVLRDEQGLLASRNFAPSQLKLVSQDELLDASEAYERDGEYYTIQAIVDHKELAPGKYLYRVRWEGYTEADDTWEPPQSFNSPAPISNYWNKITASPSPTPTRDMKHSSSHMKNTSSGLRDTAFDNDTTEHHKTTPKRSASDIAATNTRHSKRSRRHVNYRV